MAFKALILSFVYPQVLERTKSDLNGEITVTKFFGKNRIEVGGLTQSGEYVEDLLGKALKVIKKKNLKKILLLGLGGGSIVKQINKIWPKAKIVGIEIDPVMIKLGKKYLSLGKAKKLEIVIEDAIDYVQDKEKKEIFDLILIDLYFGYEYPKKAESDTFFKNLKRLLSKKGNIVINRLYFSDYKKSTDQFIKKLKKIFDQVSSKKVYSNLLIFAS